MSIAQNIIEIVRQHLPADSPVRVRAVKVRIGDMAGIVPDSLEFCFSALIDSTSLSGSRLVIERVPMNVKCNSCSEVSEIELPIFICPECQSTDLTMVSGTEMQIVDIELSDISASEETE